MRRRRRAATGARRRALEEVPGLADGGDPGGDLAQRLLGPARRSMTARPRHSSMRRVPDAIDARREKPSGSAVRPCVGSHRCDTTDSVLMAWPGRHRGHVTCQRTAMTSGCRRRSRSERRRERTVVGEIVVRADRRCFWRRRCRPPAGFEAAGLRLSDVRHRVTGRIRPAQGASISAVDVDPAPSDRAAESSRRRSAGGLVGLADGWLPGQIRSVRPNGAPG